MDALLVVLFLVPGFFAYLKTLDSKKVLGLQSTQWTFIPVIAFYSLIYLLIGIVTSELMQISRTQKLFSTDINYFDMMAFGSSILYSYLFGDLFGIIVKYSEKTKTEIFSTITGWIDSGREQPTLMIDLQGDRAYVGKFVSGDYYPGGHETISIIVVASGKRRTDGSLRINTFYSDDQSNYNTPPTTIRLSEMISLKEINFERLIAHCILGDIKLSKNAKEFLKGLE